MGLCNIDHSQHQTTTTHAIIFCKVCCYECLRLHVMKALCRLICPIYLMLQCIFKFKWQLKAQGTDLIITQVFFPLLFSFCICCYSKLACYVMGLGLFFFSFFFSPLPSNTPNTREALKGRKEHTTQQNSAFMFFTNNAANKEAE